MLQKGIYSYIETYKRLASFLSKSGLAWEEDFKKSKVKLGLLPDVDMLLMVEKHCTKRHIFFLQMFWKDGVSKKTGLRGVATGGPGGSCPPLHLSLWTKIGPTVSVSVLYGPEI